MTITDANFMKQYAMFGALSSNTNQMGAMQQNQGNKNSIDFGKSSIEGIGGQAEATKTTGANKFAGANLSFVERLDRMDNITSLTRPEAKSAVEGFDSGRAKFIDLMA